MFVPTKAEGVPKAGVTRVGEVAKTLAPVPVSSVSAVSNCREVNDPSDAALPTEVTAPVRLAFVVTFPAVKPEAVPVRLVATPEAGVPSAGATRVLFVSVSVVSRPTRVSVDVGSVRTPVLTIEEMTGAVRVLFVSVCVAVVPAKTVLASGMV